MNYDVYKSKLLQKLKYFKIPENEYSFDGERAGDCIFVKRDEDLWCVVQSCSGEQITRGTFQDESDAYDFLFYLVMKRHIGLKKRWW